MAQPVDSAINCQPESGFSEDRFENPLIGFLRHMRFRFDLLDKSRNEMNVFLARDFNVFKYIAPDENLISDILRDFLDPAGPHGQGELFLREFLEIVNPNINITSLTTDEVSVTREHATEAIPNSQRRVDIVVKIEPFPLWLGIENKPWAGDQPKQLHDYAEYLRNKVQRNFVLVYLSGSGTGPEEVSITPEELRELEHENQFVNLGYRNHLCHWLEICRQKCQADRVRDFIQDFINYIESNFSFCEVP